MEKLLSERRRYPQSRIVPGRFFGCRARGRLIFRVLSCFIEERGYEVLKQNRKIVFTCGHGGGLLGIPLLHCLNIPFPSYVWEPNSDFTRVRDLSSMMWASREITLTKQQRGNSAAWLTLTLPQRIPGKWNQLEFPRMTSFGLINRIAYSVLVSGQYDLFGASDLREKLFFFSTTHLSSSLRPISHSEFPKMAIKLLEIARKGHFENTANYKGRAGSPMTAGNGIQFVIWWILCFAGFSCQGTWWRGVCRAFGFYSGSVVLFGFLVLVYFFVNYLG